MPERLTKEEAAQYLGVSVRTIERYAHEGKLIPLYERGKTRSIATFALYNINALKVELEGLSATHLSGLSWEAQDENAASNPLRPNNTDEAQGGGAEETESAAPMIGVRLPAHYRDQLLRRAELENVPVSAMTRQMIIDLMEGNAPRARKGGAEDVSATVARLENAFERLRTDLALITLALLMKAGRCSAEEAGDWIYAHLDIDCYEDPINNTPS